VGKSLPVDPQEPHYWARRERAPLFVLGNKKKDSSGMNKRKILSAHHKRPDSFVCVAPAAFEKICAKI
jgi:hypothetical protein